MTVHRTVTTAAMKLRTTLVVLTPWNVGREVQVRDDDDDYVGYDNSSIIHLMYSNIR